MDHITNYGIARRSSNVIATLVVLIAVLAVVMFINTSNQNDITHYLANKGVAIKTDMENDRVVQGWVLDLASREIMIDVMKTTFGENDLRKSSVRNNQPMQSIVSVKSKLWSVFVSGSNDEGKSRLICERLNR